MIRKFLKSKGLPFFILAFTFIGMASGCGLRSIVSTHSFNNLILSQPQAEMIEASTPTSSKVSSIVHQGYRAVCFDGTNYLAVGTGGRIDRIASDKTVTSLPSNCIANLNSVISANGINVAVGENGIILVANASGNFQPAQSGTASALYGVTAFHGAFWAAGAGGILLSSNDGEQWTLMQSETKNDIISISANDKMCMAVTRQSQILMSEDGANWKVLDYNSIYKGYDKPYWFHSIRAVGGTFFIVGEFQEAAGNPIIMSSDTGDVWVAHMLSEINGEPMEKFLPLTIKTVGLNEDQLLAICNGGRVLTITGCSVCNKVTTMTSQDINDLSCADGNMAVVGNGFWFDILKNDTFRQYSIKAEQAQTDFKNGALIVDVRTKEEYLVSHIPGCINIPVDQIEKDLAGAIRDQSTEIIFYCAHGVRAQKALETALQMGYKRVYNLGGISDWPYEKESGSTAN